MCVGKASVVAISSPFQPDMKIKLNTASKTMTPVLLLRNQMKNADTDDKAMEMPANKASLTKWTWRNPKYKCMKLFFREIKESRLFVLP